VARKLSFISEAAACVKLFNGARRMAEARKLPVISEATHRSCTVTHRKEDALAMPRQPAARRQGRSGRVDSGGLIASPPSTPDVATKDTVESPDENTEDPLALREFADVPDDHRAPSPRGLAWTASRRPDRAEARTGPAGLLRPLVATATQCHGNAA